MRLPFAYLFLAFAASGPAHAAERSFPVSGFDRIAMETHADLDIRTGLEPSVVATGEVSDLDRLDIRVEEGRLIVGAKKRQGGSARNRVRVLVTTQTLAAVGLSGSGDVRIDRVRGPFSGRISGSGDLRIERLDSPDLSLAISGSGTMKVDGTCDAATMAITGSGNIVAAGLQCRTVKATITGSGNVTAAATETASLRTTGSGNITLGGGARCTSTTTGSGTIRCG